MAEIINLNKARKARSKASAKDEAARNRVLHGLSRAEKAEARAAAERDRLRLDGHRRGAGEDDPA